MYYFEKDYIMRLIHGIARAIARILFDREPEENEEIAVILEKTGRAKYDYLRKLVDDGDINTAEEKLFDLLETVTWASMVTSPGAISITSPPSAAAPVASALASSFVA